jgi:hypothetical protein
MHYKHLPCYLMTLAWIGWMAGCGGPAEEEIKMGQQPSQPHAHDHDHAHEGPHHGHLIELDEEYHAELVHDEKAGSVTIYILDKEAKAAVAIEAKELTVTLKHDGQEETFKLAASPQEGDGEGKSSRFVSDDKHLSDDLDAKGAEPKLIVEINGKPYTADMTHEHHHH